MVSLLLVFWLVLWNDVFKTGYAAAVVGNFRKKKINEFPIAIKGLQQLHMISNLCLKILI